MFETAEGRRLLEMRESSRWRQYGPYLSERQWGTVREDYSADGDGWKSFPFAHAHARAYRWGEDGLAGFADKNLNWCLALALWNGQDRQLKERLFGLANGEGNHGEDVKELYYFLDGLPSHAYMRMLYKYPQQAFPYEDLLARNQERGFDDPEYELIDTGIFDEGRYFDISIEYAKASADDILMRITAVNRGPEAAPLHILPQCWARNVWSWQDGAEPPQLTATSDTTVLGHHSHLPDFSLDIEADAGAEWLFCENDTHEAAVFGTEPVAGWFKDGIGEYVVNGRREAVNPARSGSKCAAHHVCHLEPGAQTVVRLRWRTREHHSPPFEAFDQIIDLRQQEADAFYAAVQTRIDDQEARLIQRQAMAGMLWSKQLYYYDVRQWLQGDPKGPPPPPERRDGPNAGWSHLHARELIAMPDSWEYPWFAAWDLAFHAVPLCLIDPEFAKQQLLLLTRESYMHPNAQLPAYEYNFDDSNPPLHAWAALRVYAMDAQLTGVHDHEFLELMFSKLALNFTWWVNRKDADGRNIFQGGFLGLDNIGLFNRSQQFPPGYTLNQSDGTAWMAMYALNLMRIALELAPHRRSYEHMAAKFFEHFLYIAEAAATQGGLWDEQDAFFYDHLCLPDGSDIPLRTRSLVGLIPLCAVEVLDSHRGQLPVFSRRLQWFLRHRPDLASLVSQWETPGKEHRILLSMLRGHRMKALLARMLDETEFLSPHGIRGVSKYHADHPYHFEWDQQQAELGYWPAESRSGMFGGNSNWRGPVWMPINYLLIDSLRAFHAYYGDDFVVEYPHGSGQHRPLNQIADALARRLIRLFMRNDEHVRPALGDSPLQQHDPAFRDLLLFHEYFDGDNGRGCGASHQTGWTALVAVLIDDLAQRQQPLRGD